MPKRNMWVIIGEYSSLAFSLPAGAFAGWVIGYYLDKAFGTHFLWIVFLFIGIASGFVQLFRMLSRDKD